MKDGVTVFLDNVSAIDARCANNNRNGPARFNIIQEILSPNSRALSVWNELRTNLANETNATLVQTIRNLMKRLSGISNLGDRARAMMRSVRHNNIRSSHYVDQLPTFEELATMFKNHITKTDWLEMAGTRHNADSVEIRMAFVDSLHEHTKTWLLRCGRNPNNNNTIDAWDRNDGLTMDQIVTELSPYEHQFIMSPGKRIPQDSAPGCSTEGPQPRP